MSRKDEAEPLDPRLQAWIDETTDVGAWAEAASTNPKDAELLSLLEAAGREPPPELSAEEATALLIRIRDGCGRHSVGASLREAVLGVAAVLFGLALGLATLPRFGPLQQMDPATASIEVIKQVSFESIHEGKVVQFQLELSRVR